MTAWFSKDIVYSLLVKGNEKNSDIIFVLPYIRALLLLKYS